MSNRNIQIFYGRSLSFKILDNLAKPRLILYINALFQLRTVGFWQNLDELQEKAVIEREFRPGIETTERNYRYSGWKKAVKRALAWEEHDEA